MPDVRPYVSHLRRWDEEEALEAANHVEQLLHHPGWTALQRLIEEAHSTAFDRVLSSHAGDAQTSRILEHAEYTRLIGFLSGLRQSQAAAEAFARHAESVRGRITNP